VPQIALVFLYDVINKPTSGADAYLMEIILDLVVGRHRRHVDPVEAEVGRVRQQVFDGHAAVVAAPPLIGQEDGPLPAVEVEHLLEGVGDASPGAADSYHRVVNVRVVQVHVTAPLRIEADVPVGSHVSNGDAPCTRNRTIIVNQ